MKVSTENLYYNLPVAVQHCLVSAYGLKLKRQRYGKSSAGFYTRLKESERFSKTQILNLQEETFLRLAHHAISSVPFYREWAATEGVSVADLRVLSDLNMFPLVSKEMLRANSNDFLSDLYRRDKLITLETSGSTGTPLQVFCDAEARTRHYAFFSRLRGWFGVHKNDIRATLFGRIILPSQHDRPPFWRWDWFNKNLLMSSYHLSQHNIGHYYQKLKKVSPAEIIGYPSSLYQIGKYIVENDLEPLSPKVVFSTAETLTSWQRSAIEGGLDAPLVDQYGCTEMAFFASQCEHGRMHSHPEHGIVESLDSDDKSVVGRPGRMIATGLINFAMPLIRYEIGDRLTIDDVIACDCGRAFPVIRELFGREDDTVYKKDGTPVGRLDPIFKGKSGIREAQIIQDRFGDIQLKICVDRSFGGDEVEILEREFAKRLGSDIEIRTQLVSELPRGSGGKFRAVKSHFKPG